MANECIPLFTPGATVTARATAAVTGKRFVGVTGATDVTNGTLIGVAHATAATKCFGVAGYDAASGARLSVETDGIVPVSCAAAITAGTEVEVGTAGKAAAKASGIAVGVAVSTTNAADTDLFVQLY